MFPRLIVFDFHNTLSLEKSELNTLLQPYKDNYRKDHQPKGPLTEDSWYNIFNIYQVDINLIMPTWKDIGKFISYIMSVSPKTIFGIASMIEQDSLILGMMKYCFQIINIRNPFNSNTVVASSTFNKYGNMNLSGKKQHIIVITRNLGLENDIKIGDTVLIDDNITYINDTYPICGVLASNYFLISDWNQAQTNRPNKYCIFDTVPN